MLMVLVVSVSVLVCLIIFYPFLRFFAKRMAMISHIKHICHRKELRYNANCFGAVLGNFKGQNCNFYIETKDKVYSVKLCGTY